MTQETPVAQTHISLGWGIQSTCLAAMVALKKLPPVDFAIHADTGHERQDTYDYAQRWTPWLEARGVPIVTVQAPVTSVTHPSYGKTSVQVPAFTVTKSNGKKGQIKRQCTSNWKVRPVRRYIRSQLPGRPKPGSVHALMGISLDEFTRMRSSEVQYIVNKYPLVNDLKMTRQDCVQWLQDNNIEVPPKSACTFCPFHNKAAWIDLKHRGGPDWEEAILADLEVRDMRADYTLYIHPARVPLDEAIKIPVEGENQQLGFDLEEAGCDGGVCFV